MFKRGTIVLIPFPFTDLTAAKVRPALIVSDASKTNEDFTVVFISSIIRQRLEPSHLLLRTQDKDFEKSGLKYDSVIQFDKLATLSKSICLGEMGRLDGKMLEKGDRMLKKYLGLK